MGHYNKVMQKTAADALQEALVSGLIEFIWGKRYTLETAIWRTIDFFKTMYGLGTSCTRRSSVVSTQLAGAFRSIPKRIANKLL